MHIVNANVNAHVIFVAVFDSVYYTVYACRVRRQLYNLVGAQTLL